MTITTETTDTEAAALACIRAGLSIVPIDNRTKRPAMHLLPKGDDGKPTWEPYQSEIPDEATVRSWFKRGCKAFALVCGNVSGGLLVLDFDKPEFYDAWQAAVGKRADGIPIQRTPGGYHAFMFCENPGRNDKLAWTPDENEDAGRKVAIETRGEGGYAVAPPSLHPSGDRYKMLVGSLTDIPAVSQTLVDELVDAARKLDEAPHTRQELQRLEPQAQTEYRRRHATRNGQASVIDAFNAKNALDAMLERHGYTRAGEGRFKRPGGASASVSVKDGKSCHFSSNDPLNDGRVKGIGVHDSFDVWAHFEHAGNASAAVKAAAKELGMTTRDDAEPTTPSEPVLVNMADVETRHVRWIWPKRIPQGRLSMIVGMPGDGKSFSVADISARITRGIDFPDGEPCEPGDVLMISGEDDPHDQIRPRLDACGADVSRVHLLSMVRRLGEDGKPFEVMFTLADVAALEIALQRIPNCRLVVVDPIGSFLGGEVDMHRDNEVRGILTPLAKLAERFNVAGLIIAHRRKAQSNHADDTALGSRAFTGICRMIWHLSRDRENRARRLLLPGKCNLAAEPTGLAFTIEGDPARIVWESDAVEMTADEAMSAENGRPSEFREDVQTWLRDELADLGEHSVEDVRTAAGQAGFNWRRVQRAREDIGAIVHRASFGGKFIWRLPKPGQGDSTTPHKTHGTVGTIGTIGKEQPTHE